MAQVFVKYNPYRLQTLIKVNGKDIEADSSLQKYVKGKRLQEWVGNFPQELRNEFNTLDFDVEFYGMELDRDDFEFAFRQAQETGVIRNLSLKFIQGQSSDIIVDTIIGIFDDLRTGPIEDFRDPKLVHAFDSIRTAVFPVNVVATMSSGKSTLINALLNKKLMPAKNEACTATITEITDNDSDSFTANVYNQDGELIEEIPNLTYEVMDRLNSNPEVHRIVAKGDIPFIDARTTALMLVDTPGPNNSQNQAHKNTTYRAIHNDNNNLILYVLNGTQLSTNDDASLLDYVAEQIAKGGKQIRDRFLFVINKMDSFNPEEENIANVVDQARKYLASHGIYDPQIFPCSAFTALNLSTTLRDVDIDNLSRAQEKKLPSAARDALTMIDKFIEYDSMHLEQYSILAPSTKRELEYRLAQAQENGDTKMQAFIHCGLYSIEAAITAYVKKYAQTKKIKDLVESFNEVLDSSKVLLTAKDKVRTDADAARAYVARAEAVKSKIQSGQDAKKFKARIASFNPMAQIERKAENLQAEVDNKTTAIFRHYGNTITSRAEAKRLVMQFAEISSNALAQMSAELESVINHEVVDTGEKMLLEYQEKLTRFDKDSAGGELDFGTVDLIKGALKNMQETVASWSSDEFAASAVEDFGDVTYETKTWHEKVGQQAEEVIVGSHEEKIGTHKVKVGSHKEKVGSHREYVGTKQIKNPNKKWWSFWRDSYITVDDYRDVNDYKTVDDYKDEDVYKTVLDYQTVMRDVFEERTERIEKFSLDTDKIQTALVGKFRRNIDDGIGNALQYADAQIDNMKKQFMIMFDELDKLIAQKYSELEEFSKGQQLKEQELENNRKILAWIEDCCDKIDGTLEI